MAGQHRIGKYLAERTLGTGSFATVWLAFDEILVGTLDAKLASSIRSHDVGDSANCFDQPGEHGTSCSA